MIVVSNTSPLTNLAAIGQFDLLRDIYGEIHIPVAVWMALLDDLDRGEAESIMLALELGADLLLLDEADGRHHAQRLGLRVVGAIGTLVAAKDKGRIDALRPHLDALRSVAGFYIGEQLYRAVLASASE